MVIHTTRRNAEIRTDDGRTLTLSFSSKVEAVAPGDRVALENRREGTVISSILPRKNCFFRSYRGERKIIASNLDRIFLVSAVVPLFNTHFVDRVLAFCALQAIPVTLVINKIDLDLSASKPLVEIYRSLGAEMLRTSALASSGLTELCAALADPALGIVAMAGISGVGKSSLLNRLIPTAGIKTCRVSHKTGQGRRTTSQAIAYPYPRLPAPDLLIIDLPGVHAFGVTHLSEREVVGAFPSSPGRMPPVNSLIAATLPSQSAP